MTASDTLIIIPARMAAARLPGKPLVDLGGKPMVVRTLQLAVRADIGPVVVATDSDEIAEAVTAAGGVAVMTRPDHASGSDRVHEAARIFDAQDRHQAVLNLQGDYPTLDPETLRATIAVLDDPAVDIATAASVITDARETTDPDTPRLIGTPVDWHRLRALYFTRGQAPFGEGPHYHHIGIYAYRRAALDAFVALPPSTLEKRERLEQLRALEAGMRIDAALVDAAPIGVDTPADLEAARKHFAT